ncbi:MAG: capsule assembly Wzi family protein [Gammaproteobacteria bacterium]|nr:capsule assembly Wzi family protein [Gammaproteobacteria bacterium]MBU1553486.1 capsule assembly Wzi family protein [Gammaproteobacteria bacterium]MBU2070958.1 capsule assembly Wzi family protein [Gammaproteobacteria bacterium]MBU2183784.1 capsule assembly Wzi family protein [Gammaproteobacteria bacterium]MBU2206517.1 capsule assembly Wzi family protein [Gammaproteobacteria bacterium]
MKRNLSALALWFGSASLMAAPWVDTTDNYLRQSLQTLAQAGILTGPVNTYPLMWKNIAADLARADEQSVAELRFALAHVRAALHASQHSYIAGVKLKASSDPSLFQSFGESYFEQSSVSVFKEYLGDNWAGKSQLNYRNTADNNTEQDLTYDGSYLALIAGNWVLAVDQLPLWWGPGQQSSLLLSNNARPIPSLRISRHSWQASEASLFSWLGPWSFTAYLGQGEHQSNPAQIKHFGARFSARPLPQLELGLSRISQWGGDTLDNSAAAFADMLLLRSDSDDNADNMAAVDFTFHTRLAGWPLSFYGELADDNNGGQLTKPLQLYGVRSYFGSEAAVHTLSLEWSDSYIRCDGRAQAGNCAYESELYPQGYRRYGRLIGSGYGADAQVLSAGYRYQTFDGYSWAATLLRGRFVSDTTALHNWQLRLEYRQPLFNGLLSLEGRVFDKSPQPELKIKRASLAATWEYRF